MNELQSLYAIERVLPQLKFNISYPIFLSPSLPPSLSPSLSGDKNGLNIKMTAACRQTGHHIRLAAISSCHQQDQIIPTFLLIVRLLGHCVRILDFITVRRY